MSAQKIKLIDNSRTEDIPPGIDESKHGFSNILLEGKGSRTIDLEQQIDKGGKLQMIDYNSELEDNRMHLVTGEHQRHKMESSPFHAKSVSQLEEPRIEGQ